MHFSNTKEIPENKKEIEPLDVFLDLRYSECSNNFGAGSCIVTELLSSILTCHIMMVTNDMHVKKNICQYGCQTSAWIQLSNPVSKHVEMFILMSEMSDGPNFYVILGNSVGEDMHQSF